MDEYAQFKITYFAECAELLADVETQLSELGSGSEDPEVLHAIFRAVHSIKAGAGAFKFTKLAEFSHQFEALLDRMRDGRIQVTEEGVGILFRASDILSAMVESAENETPLLEDFGSQILEEIKTIISSDEEPSPATPVMAVLQQTEDTIPVEKNYTISFAPKTELFKHANEPLLIVRELKTLGNVTAKPSLERLPLLQKLDGEEAYISWIFTLQSEAPLVDVEEVFEFVTEDCDLNISLVAENQDEEETKEVNKSHEKPSDLDQVTTPKATKLAAKQNIGTPKATSIRVDLDRVDLLVNTVGELVITQSMLSQQTNELPTDQFPNMVRGLEELALHTRELQESVMAIRMQPVKSVFSRMPRLVRELSAKLGKTVKLTTIGENTEVDKTVIEEISDPITHMIRNSLDHGLETTEERLAAGKPETGQVTLSAEHRGGRIIITISDDGRGINRKAVIARARERGLIGDTVTPPDDEVDNMIFAPGFSTAEKVTDVSGRGVGMDVVRRNIQALGGRISIQSAPGKGSKFIMTLPLTLAVMDGMIIEVGGAKYVIPIPNILESFRPPKEALKQLPTGQNLVYVRGEYIPICHLQQIFNVRAAEQDPSKALIVLTETEESGTVGIVVDQIVGQQQVVIKSLESNYRPVPGISAATILGNGKVAPIIDVEAIYLLSQQLMINSTLQSDSAPVPTDTLEEVSIVEADNIELASDLIEVHTTPIG